jgi:hypothetical protein
MGTMRSTMRCTLAITPVNVPLSSLDSEKLSKTT